MDISILKEKFGSTSNGADIYKFTLSNKNDISVSILNFGCVIYEIKLPDKDGNIVDVNLGFDTVKDYETNENNFGVLCGRVANRISGAQFTLDGVEYHISKNDPFGGNYIHGGFKGFGRTVWAWSIKDNKLILRYNDPDGSEGLPGEVLTYVTYTLDDDNTLTMDYKSTTTKPTIIDMGSHFMVNLAGHDNGPITDHVITINSDQYLEAGDDHLPTGKILSVEDDKIMDFRRPVHCQGDFLKNITSGFALHTPYVFDRRGEKKFMARIDHPASKRYMEVYSTNSTMFAYSCHFVEIINGDKPCKDGVVYKQYGGIECMPMGYPNAINTAGFPSSVVRPEKPYHEVAWYKFGVLK